MYMNKIRFGILGPGKISHRFVKGINHSKQAVITAVGGRDYQKTSAYAKQYNIGVYTDYPGLVACDVVDAVYIALPQALHKEWIIKALLAGNASGVIASLCSAITVEGPKEARIYGSDGYIVLPDFWKSSSVELIRYDGNDEVFFIDQPSEFTHYIDHGCECIKKGLSESPILTKAINELMIRLITSK